MAVNPEKQTASGQRGPEIQDLDYQESLLLFERLHSELHRLATQAMARERKDHTLQPTALLHEVWLRLNGKIASREIGDPAHLVHAATLAMRQILVDHARHRTAEKRGGRGRRIPLDEVLDYCDSQSLDVRDIHDALNDLTQVHERQATILTLRFFWSFTVEEVASLLDVSEGTVENDFRLARAWLRRQLK
jgi:RNA polymerase sigma-70 factor (ECF subfamily)